MGFVICDCFSLSNIINPTSDLDENKEVYKKKNTHPIEACPSFGLKKQPTNWAKVSLAYKVRFFAKK